MFSTTRVPIYNRPCSHSKVIKEKRFPETQDETFAVAYTSSTAAVGFVFGRTYMYERRKWILFCTNETGVIMHVAKEPRNEVRRINDWNLCAQTELGQEYTHRILCVYNRVPISAELQVYVVFAVTTVVRQNAQSSKAAYDLKCTQSCICSHVGSVSLCEVVCGWEPYIWETMFICLFRREFIIILRKNIIFMFGC